MGSTIRGTPNLIAWTVSTDRAPDAGVSAAVSPVRPMAAVVTRIVTRFTTTPWVGLQRGLRRPLPDSSRFGLPEPRREVGGIGSSGGRRPVRAGGCRGRAGGRTPRRAHAAGDDRRGGGTGPPAGARGALAAPRGG